MSTVAQTAATSGALHLPRGAPALRTSQGWAELERFEPQVEQYPCGVDTFSPAVHDVRYYQAVLRNEENFCKETSNSEVEIFRAWRSLSNGRREWKNTKSVKDVDLEEYLTEAKLKEDQAEIFQAIFCNIGDDYSNSRSFGRQLLVSQSSTQRLLTTFNISPQFFPLLLGQPHYWSPGNFITYDTEGRLKHLEFFCQHPRWNIHVKKIPMSVYMAYNPQTYRTTYIVVGDLQSATIATVKERLVDLYVRLDHCAVGGEEYKSLWNQLKDPFLLHSMLANEAFEESKDVIHRLRGKLYDQLDVVDSFSKGKGGQGFAARMSLDTLTKELHIVSQDADGLLSSADMGIMLCKELKRAHERFVELCLPVNQQFLGAKIADATRYMLVSLESQKRWLLSYKSRKDIAMNLVFNLVTQQDSHTNLEIARDAKRDSSSMHTISTLTMIFLPGMFVAGIFGMNFFDFEIGGGHDSMVASKRLWLYFVLTLALTVLVVAIWMCYDQLRSFVLRMFGYKEGDESENHEKESMA